MPALPTISPTQDQFDRIVGVFPGSTAAEKTVAYQTWLTNMLIDLVGAVEAARAVASVEASLPPRLPQPVFK